MVVMATMGCFQPHKGAVIAIHSLYMILLLMMMWGCCSCVACPVQQATAKHVFAVSCVLSTTTLLVLLMRDESIHTLFYCIAGCFRMRVFPLFHMSSAQSIDITSGTTAAIPQLAITMMLLSVLAIGFVLVSVFAVIVRCIALLKCVIDDHIPKPPALCLHYSTSIPAIPTGRMQT